MTFKTIKLVNFRTNYLVLNVIYLRTEVVVTHNQPLCKILLKFCKEAGLNPGQPGHKWIVLPHVKEINRRKFQMQELLPLQVAELRQAS
jgi:hypothetical protein